MSLQSSTNTPPSRSEEHTSELQSRRDLVCRLLLEKKKKNSGVAKVLREATKVGIVNAVRYSYLFSCYFRDFNFFFLFLLLYQHIRFFFFFNDTATTEIYTLSLHDALPI